MDHWEQRVLLWTVGQAYQINLRHLWWSRIPAAVWWPQDAGHSGKRRRIILAACRAVLAMSTVWIHREVKHWQHGRGRQQVQCSIEQGLHVAKSTFDLHNHLWLLIVELPNADHLVPRTWSYHHTTSNQLPLLSRAVPLSQIWLNLDYLPLKNFFYCHWTIYVLLLQHCCCSSPNTIHYTIYILYCTYFIVIYSMYTKVNMSQRRGGSDHVLLFGWRNGGWARTLLV